MTNEYRPMSSADSPDRPPGIDTTVAHPARRYNYWLGGKDHFAADRASGDAILSVFPSVKAAALENRAFLRRAVTFLAQEAGVRQFLDIGTGIPAPDNTHEVAQAVAPDSRVVYVDNDPIVLSHARALLSSSAEGSAAYLEADLRDYPKILEHPDLTRSIDLSQPVALLLVAILHFLPDTDEPYAVVAGLVEALPPGSFLVVSHATADYTPVQTQAKLTAVNKQGAFYPRSKDQFERFFDGLELVAPGIVSVADWRVEDEPRPRLSAADAAAYGAIGHIG